MRQFKIGDQEYLSNGHYEIEGIEFMSIWTFKRSKGLDCNTNSINGNEGMDLLNKGVANYISTPDFGGFGKIYIYPVLVLREYYGV